MNTYVEITDQLGVDYYYARLYFSGDYLTLQSPQGFLRKNVQKKIRLSEITNLVMDTFWGGRRITFSFDKEDYTFFESGTGVVDYLQTNLSL
ncbi:hypothetical protein IGI37_002578 [Enterococcus sp. AZ194]|uniref:hypothetical protein n=1 Tax=Enterococcus sp. AZ194 TaxID=2774629 RepID=UPI003F254AB4